MTNTERRPALPVTFWLNIAGLTGFAALALTLLVITSEAPQGFMAAGNGLVIGVGLGGLSVLAAKSWRG